jgi:hypothetical protein
MRIPLALLALSLAACASSGTTSDPGAPAPAEMGRTTRMHPMGTGMDVTPTEDAAPVGTALPFAPQRVWAALAPAYGMYGISLTEQSPSAGTVGNGDFRAPRILRGQRLSTYLDCTGIGQSGAPGADVYTVRMAVRSRVVPTPEGSRLETTVTAFARNMDGTNSSPVHCTSTGKLENGLAAAVLTNIGS